MRRTELQAEIIALLEALESGYEARRFRDLSRALATKLGFESRTLSTFTRGFLHQLELCHRDKVTSQEDVSGRVADWIQDITS